jgi:hypothetical protein
MSGVRVDGERAILRGPPDAVRGVIAGDPVTPVSPPLEAALRAARAPAARFALSGLGADVVGLADRRAGALLVAEDDELTLRACTPSGLLGLLARATGLGPRPRPAIAPLRLTPGALATALAERSAPAAGLGAARRAELQAHLDALRTHWRLEARREDGRGWYLEVLDTDRGLWSLAADGPDAVTLTPTDATRVLDELAALPGHAGLG